jgi:hypothetical protein
MKLPGDQIGYCNRVLMRSTRAARPVPPAAGRWPVAQHHGSHTAQKDLASPHMGLNNFGRSLVLLRGRCRHERDRPKRITATS